MNSITKEDVKTLLLNTSKMDEFNHLNIDIEVFEHIAKLSGHEIRTALNMLESLKLLKGNVTVEKASSVLGMKAMRLDQGEDSYYDLLSAFQKSIRGSDVDASLYYLARLLKTGDLDIITRRITTIAYEDVGLANPGCGPKAVAACHAALNLGLPEARIPLSAIVIDLALSPKSNSAEKAIDNALFVVDNEPQYDIPRHILNREIKGESGLYKYPHDYEGDICYQEYMPTEIRNKVFYEAKYTGKYERALADQNLKVKQILKK